jgi:hypothetical protein
MRENRTYGSEGGEGLHPFPTPIEKSVLAAMDRNWITASFAGVTRDRKNLCDLCASVVNYCYFLGRIASASRTQ